MPAPDTSRQHHHTTRETILSCCLLSFLLLSSAVSTRAADYEKPVILQAKSILQPKLLKGKYHKVDPRVKNDGLFNHYAVTSTFGNFQANSSWDMEILVREIEALAAMKKVKTDDTALAGLKQSGQNTVTGLKNLFNDPQATLEGAASGVSSLFTRAKETIGRREVGDAEDSNFEQFVGISKSKGMIATKYGVNLYSRNKILQAELNRLGRADYAGGLGVGLASSFVPGVGGLILTTSGTARLLNEAINTTPAAELWLQNKKNLLAMNLDADIVELFLNNPTFSPATATVLVTALESMNGVNDRGLFIKVALQASDPAMARLITRIAVMSAGYHKHIAPLKQFMPMARLPQGVRRDGTRIILLPADYITWNRLVADAETAVLKQARGKGLELWITGSLSERARAELQKKGWKINDRASPRLFAAQK